MELLLAIVAGVLYATGLYLMLRRRLAQLIIGLGLLSNGSNVLILSAAGVMRARPPLISEGNTTADQFADPVPQSLILTAIVIGFGVLAFALVLAHRVHQSAGSDDIDSIGPDFAKAPSDRPDSARAGLDKPDPA
jgi:multicomponent Na+:H+ antiporter subunit C